MERRLNASNQSGSTTSNSETIVNHTPKVELSWQYNLVEGGQKYKVDLPHTEKQINKIKQELLHPRNWKRYHRSPYGGNVNYTQVLSFPPFDVIRVAEVFFPDGSVWSSTQRKFINKK